MGLVGDILFSRMEDARIAIHATRQSGFDAVTLLENLKFFTDISSAIVKEVEILRRGKWGKRLLGDRAAVVFKGFVTKEVLIDNYLASDIFVLPSEDNNEAFGIVVIEAMLYGNVIIGTDIPGIRGAVKKCENCNVSLIPPKKWEPL